MQWIEGPCPRCGLPGPESYLEVSDTEDELDELMAEKAGDPEFAAAYRDAHVKFHQEQDLEDPPMCACGLGLHYPSREAEEAVLKIIQDKGEYVEMSVPGRKGVWLVQRHYIALHGINAAELPESDMWEKVG